MADNKKTIDDINRYCFPNSILVIDSKGRLRRLYCPFKVKVIKHIHYLRINDTVDVLAVKISSDLVLLYVVNQLAYPYYCFIILDQVEYPF
jgi:hypothetical protein